MPLAVTEQSRVRDPGSALAEVKHEVQASSVELEDGVVHLVLMSRVEKEATGSKGPDAQLNLEPGGERGTRKVGFRYVKWPRRGYPLLLKSAYLASRREGCSVHSGAHSPGTDGPCLA